MNKEIFDIRIKAWLCSITLVLLIVGVFVGLSIAPVIVSKVLLMILGFGALGLFAIFVLVAFAIWFDEKLS
jgi:uncharacterized membrane protein SpoIIM required for sporulation